MKAFRVLLVLALVMAAFGVATGAKAQAFTYSSGFQVQNLEAAVAAITITFYEQDGTQAAQVNDTIPANGSKTFFPLNQVDDGFNGSVVISSDKQVAAIGNILGDGGIAAASYSAATTGSNTVYIPLLMKENSGGNTWFNVQNTGASVANITIEYSDGLTVNDQIQPGSAKTFKQGQEVHTAKVFSAIITSDQPIAATVLQETATVMFAYSGFTSGSTAPVMPLINSNNNGIVTGMQVQNAGDAETVVTVSYTPAGAGMGTACTETQTIAAGQSNTFTFYAFAGVAFPAGTNGSTTCTAGSRMVGSAEVTTNSTNQPLTVIVNQLSAANGGSYNGFAAGSDTVVMPLILDRLNGYFTGFNVMNIGATSTTVTCSFTDSTVTVSQALEPGAALNALQAGQLGDPYVGSATCSAPGGEIIGVVNEAGPATAADQLLVYEGVNP